MILSIDPGACSGWALYDGGGAGSSGTVNIDTAKGLREAWNLLVGVDTMVIEGMGYLPAVHVNGKAVRRYDTAYGMGKHAGQWIACARLQEIPFVIVHPSEWQRAMLHPGGRNPGRDMLKRLSVARATQIVGHAVGVDEADAIVLGWYATEQGRKA